MINNVCIIDLETTGLDPTQDQVIELGAILYSVKHQTILEQFSCLLFVQENPQEYTNKIPAKATHERGYSSSRLDRVLMDFADDSDYLIAHNAAFDKQWNLFDELWQPWLCTCEDFIWPKNHQKANLINTCLNHGIGVTKVHRALSDCQLIAELFDRADDLQGLFEKAIARSQEPLLTVLAGVNYDTRHLAQKAKFYWEPNKKVWQKEIKQSDLLVESINWNFKYEVVDG